MKLSNLINQTNVILLDISNSNKRNSELQTMIARLISLYQDLQKSIENVDRGSAYTLGKCDYLVDQIARQSKHSILKQINALIDINNQIFYFI